MSANILKPDYLFEVSWEVCNKIGGLHTSLYSKSASLEKEFENNYVLIGPDIVHDSSENPEFIPEPGLFSEWNNKADKGGIRVKIGRWNIAPKPIVFLIDFSNLLEKKDEILSKLWEDYKLDSISGQWDYVEPTLFGYAVGKIIESFVKFNVSSNEKVATHFHDWLTGAGILYLKKHLPQVANVFTAHSTVIGRTLAANNKKLYEQIDKIKAEEVAKEYFIISKYSLEKITAHESDVFTTVSDITSRECKSFLERDVDIITQNGFEESLIPDPVRQEETRLTARKKMLEVASKLTNSKIPENAFIVSTSGNYEFRNKGYDVFINAIKKLGEQSLNRPVVAFLFVPANHYGPRKDLQEAIESNTPLSDESSKLITHHLHEPDFDPIINQLNTLGFKNKSEDNTHIIFVPSYLNGHDGVFNLNYFDLLSGCDQTIFPYYYEPWGNSPLESLVYKIPTITTSLSGFGSWVLDENLNDSKSITVIKRDDNNDAEVIDEIVDTIYKTYNLSDSDIEYARNNAYQISQAAMWRSFIFFYKQSYALALQKSSGRSDQFVTVSEAPVQQSHEHITPLSNDPKWNRVIVKSNLPKELKKLGDLSQNIWWVWDTEAQELYETIDPKVWVSCDYTPSILFEQVPYKRLQDLSKDKEYVDKLNAVYNRFTEYIKGREELTAPHIAYFSMEFGFHDSLKLYSGGLGILAGDYLKEASDAKVNIVAVSLLYRYGYFTQVMTSNGEQQASYEYQHFSKLPLQPVRSATGEIQTIQIMLPGRVLYCRIWELNVGRLKMYLLDTDFEKNSEEDRLITHQLYGGDKENRLKQEIVLGIGGIRALEILGITPDLYHSNEGHSAFIGIERIRNYMHEKKFTFDEAKEIVRSSTLFTTHTPVPAGHDHFKEDLLRKYLGHFPSRIQISWEEFMALGRENPNNWDEEFNMSYLAAHMAQDINGVSMLHGAVTRGMFAKLWPGFLPDELHIGHVTNGVHWSTWTAKEWKELYAEVFDGNFVDNQRDLSKWQKFKQVDDNRIWDIKEKLRSKLINTVKERFKENWIKRHEDPKNIVAVNNILSDKALTVVFARRFATYKRAHLLFKNLDRLAKLVNNKDMPIQFIFAGKAHPADMGGQKLIKMILDISKKPEFLGKILFLQNYSIGLAKQLVSGADIWINTPTRPLEASGTSGEKAVMNGGLHFSVLDGWWVEGYQPEAGWALTNERTYENQEFQDDLDAEIIYSMFENEILPLFYNRNKAGTPEKWVKYIKNSLSEVAPKFTTRRMINDYEEKYYSKLYERSLKIGDKEFAMANKLSTWKKHISRSWKNIEVMEVSLFDKHTETVMAGTEYKGKVILNLNEISAKHVGVELIVTKNSEDLEHKQKFELVNYEDGRAVYEINLSNDHPGTYNYGIRVFPVHEHLPHRQDFGLLKWI